MWTPDCLNVMIPLMFCTEKKMRHDAKNETDIWYMQKKLRKGVGIKAGNNAGHADLHMIIWFNNHAKALKNLRWPWKQFGIKTTDVSYRLKAPNTSDYSVKRVLNLYLLRPCFWYKPLIHRSQSPARGPDPAREGFKSGPRAFLELFCILTISCK